MTIRANGKLDEARYFLGEMAGLDGLTELDRPEVFGYNFSAFLSAALSIEYALRREVQSCALAAERADWLTSLPSDVQKTIAFFETARHEAVHEAGTHAEQEVMMVDWWSIESKSRPFRITGRPAPIFFKDEIKMGVARYRIDVAGTSFSVVEISRSYIDALAQFAHRCKTLPPNTSKQPTGPRRKKKP